MPRHPALGVLGHCTGRGSPIEGYMRPHVVYSLGKGHPNGQPMKTSNRHGAQIYPEGWECSLVSGGGLGHVYLGFWKLLDIWGKILHLSFSLWMSLVFHRQWPLPWWMSPSTPHQALEDSPWSFSHCWACSPSITALKKYSRSSDYVRDPFLLCDVTWVSL